jgi:hypothetical protein
MYKPTLSEIATKLNVSITYLRVAIQRGHCAWATCNKMYKRYAYMVNYELFFTMFWAGAQMINNQPIPGYAVEG